MTHWYLSHDAFMCVAWLGDDPLVFVTWRIHVCGVTHSCVWSDSFMCVAWLIHVCEVTHSCVWRDSAMRAIRNILRYDVSRWNWRGSRIKCGCHWQFDWCVIWLLRVCHMTYLYFWRDSFTWATWRIDIVAWRIHTCDMTHYITVWMSHVTHMNESCHTYEWVMAHIRMSHVTDMNQSCHTYEWVMSNTCMRHVKHINASCHTHKCVMSNT